MSADYDRPYYYGLDLENRPYPLSDVMDWVRWHDTHPDQADIGYETWYECEEGRLIEVSTRYFGTLGCLWETLAFVNRVPLYSYQHRYETYAAAIAGHADTLLLCRQRWPSLSSPLENSESEASSS